MNTGKSPRVLVVAEQAPDTPSQLNHLLARPDLRFTVSRLSDAVEALQTDPYMAAVILGTHHCFNGQQKDLIRVLDSLAARHTSAVMITYSDADFQAGQKLGDDGTLMVVPHTISADELHGRLAGIASAKRQVDQLLQENQLLRKFETGVNNQMSQIDEEMRLAARLQNDFLPRKLPEVNGCAFNVLFRPASYVSGDIYDAFRLDEHHVGFYIADAVGHGMPAALLTIFIKRTLKTKEITDSGYRIIKPSEALAALNEELLSQQLSHCQFATMIYCVLNTRTLEMEYARAGHPLPLYFKTDGGVAELAADGALLGVFPDERFELEKLQLSPGDNLLLYSDGFESAYHDPSGVANERYRDEFAKLSGPHARERFEKMILALDHEEGSLHPRDDVTALLLSVATRG